MFSFEGLSLMLLNFLQVPPGSSLRKNYGTSSNRSTSEFSQYIENNDLINSVLDITVDDVCIGRKPFTYVFKDGTPDSIKQKIDDQILPQFNKIAKWVARDLLKRGYSVYETAIYDGEFTLNPIIDECEFYLDSRNNVVVFNIDEEGNREAIENLTDVIVFLNFDKESLVHFDDNDNELKGKGIKYGINPSPIQLKNITTTAKDLYTIEQSLLRYRSQLARIVRFISVDVGLSQGDQQQTVIDNISSAINANSMSLGNMAGTSQDYDDNIPVVPTRRGIGKPELTESIPSANISDTTDLDKAYQKLFLGLKFPKSYATFDEALGSAAVSTIRGDIRYNRLVTDCRSLMEDTTNEFLWTNKILKKWQIEFQLTGMPSSEDEDVISALGGYHDFLQDMFDLIIENSHTRQEAVLKVTLMSDLMGKSTNIPNLSKFLDDLRLLIKHHKFEDDESDITETESEGPSGGPNLSGSEFESFDFDEEPAEESEEPEETSDFEVDVEDVEPSTESELNG